MKVILFKRGKPHSEQLLFKPKELLQAIKAHLESPEAIITRQRFGHIPDDLPSLKAKASIALVKES